VKKGVRRLFTLLYDIGRLYQWVYRLEGNLFRTKLGAFRNKLFRMMMITRESIVFLFLLVLEQRMLALNLETVVLVAGGVLQTSLNEAFGF